MATNWPNSVQTFTNPSAGDSLNSPSHSAQHTTVNDTVEALQEYAGMVLVKTQAIGSGVSSVTVTNAFSATFDNYKVIVTGITVSSTRNLLVRLGSLTNGHYGGSTRTFYTSSTISVINKNNDSNWYAGELSNAASSFHDLEFYNPQNTGLRKGFKAISYGSGYSLLFTGGHSTTTSETSFMLYPASGTFTGGTIRVYGYNNG